MPRFSAHDLAERVLSPEDNSHAEPSALLQSAEDACQKLRSELRVWLGPEGAYALLDQALRKTRASFDFRGVEIGRAGECLSGLMAQNRAEDPARLRPVLVALLANMLSLLGSLIGEQLASSVVARCWPGVIEDDPDLLKR